MSLVPVACAADPPLLPSQSNQKVSLQKHRDINTYHVLNHQSVKYIQKKKSIISMESMITHQTKVAAYI